MYPAGPLLTKLEDYGGLCIGPQVGNLLAIVNYFLISVRISAAVISGAPLALICTAAGLFDFDFGVGVFIAINFMCLAAAISCQISRRYQNSA